MTTIAFLGLGHMGGPMAANLVAAGHTVRGFDPVTTLRDAAAEKGAAVYNSGADAVAGADVVITSLPNGAVVKACYAEILPAAKEGRAADRHVDDLGRRRPRDPSAVGRGRAGPTRRPGVGRHQGRDRRHAGLHGRRRGRRRRARPARAGSDGGQGHSLRRVRRRAGRQTVQQHGAGRSADRRSARRSCWPRSSACPRSRCST